METSFSSKAKIERYKTYAGAIISNVRKEFAARAIPHGNSKFVVFCCDPSVSKCVDLANQNITLRGCAHPPMTADKIYRFLAVLIFSHITRLSKMKGIEVLHAANSTSPCACPGTKCISCAPFPHFGCPLHDRPAGNAAICVPAAPHQCTVCT